LLTPTHRNQLMQNVIIHCKESILNDIQDSTLDYQFNDGELNVIIPFDSNAVVINNQYSNDEEYCKHYGINYDLVNSIELI